MKVVGGNILIVDYYCPYEIRIIAF